MENVLCSLCSGQILNDAFEKLDFDKIRNLKITLSLNVSINEGVIICPKCVQIYQLSYDFKTTCVNNNNYVKTFIHPSVDKKLILEEIILKKIKSEFKSEEEKVCRFCLNYFETGSLVEVNTEHDTILKDMSEKCLSELELNTVQNPFICKVCMERLEKFFNFISHCEATDTLRKLKTGNESFVIDLKTSNINVNSSDDYVNNSLVKKEEYCEEIKLPEIDIKSEENLELQEDELKFRESNSLRAAAKIGVNQSNNVKKKFACHLCSFQAHRRYNLTQHYMIHEEVGKTVKFKCNKCMFVTKWKSNLVSHCERHKNPSEITKYRCDKCPYETIWKKNIKSHKVCHLSDLERVLYKCTECPYQVKFKRYLKKHMKTHADNKSESYICNECHWGTNYKSSLITHLKLHQGNKHSSKEDNVTSDIKRGKFSCKFCFYTTEKRQSLKSHYKVHRSLEEFKQYKCTHCSYVGYYRSNLLQHLNIHKNSAEREIYNCSGCSYQFRHKHNMKRHYKKYHSSSVIGRS